CLLRVSLCTLNPATVHLDLLSFPTRRSSDLCKVCPFREGCYTAGAKSKTYSVTIKSDEHSKQAKFQETDYFKEKSKERYKIEAKNSELKHRHGYDVSKSSGLISMEMQGA